MKRLFVVSSLLFALIYTSCSPRLIPAKTSKKNVKSKTSEESTTKPDTFVRVYVPPKETPEPKDPVLVAEMEADSVGKAVLETGRKMVEDEEIIKGSCWDYINEVYKRSGYGVNKEIVYKSKKSGPYADVSMIKPGDWIYHVNYSYHGVEHSGIFVYWKDYENKIGVTLSYGGENRKNPGRYREYDLKSVYYIQRGKSD